MRYFAATDSALLLILRGTNPEVIATIAGIVRELESAVRAAVGSDLHPIVRELVEVREAPDRKQACLLVDKLPGEP